MTRRSIMQDASEPRCYVTGATSGLHWHHIVHGPNRSMAEREGLTCYLRADVHMALHDHREPWSDLDTRLKRECQRRFEETGRTREEWRKLVGKSYL